MEISDLISFFTPIESIGKVNTLRVYYHILLIYLSDTIVVEMTDGRIWTPNFCQRCHNNCPISKCSLKRQVEYIIRILIMKEKLWWWWSRLLRVPWAIERPSSNAAQETAHKKIFRSHFSMLGGTSISQTRGLMLCNDSWCQMQQAVSNCFLLLRGLVNFLGTIWSI